jgi:hypothetical protein
MKCRLNRTAVVVTLLAAFGLSHPAAAQDAEVVMEWNRILQTTVASTATPRVFFTRPYAVTSIAVFDAVNAIDRVYRPYGTEVDAAPNASRAAAAAQAAHDVLAVLYPGQQAPLDTALAATLSGLPQDAARDGARVGAAAARSTLELRANDGWDRMPTFPTTPCEPGFLPSRSLPPRNVR